MRILYSGLLRSPASWARVGRCLLGALHKHGAQVACLKVRGFLYAPSFPLPEGIREVSRDDPADIELTFAHPGLYHRLKAPRRIGLLVYETDRLPQAWVDPIRTSLDLLLLPSEFCRKSAIKAGVPSHRIGLLPYGVDTAIFQCGNKRAMAPFTFLTVAAPHIRKGIRELFQAYRQAFTKDDRVRLILKTTYDPGKRRRHFRWELNGLDEEIRAAGLDQPDAPELMIITDVLKDAELAALYRQAHVYVQPSYGEAFGLAPLEAAACGCAVIMTGWSATTEFLDAQAALHVPYQLISGGPYEYDRDSDGLMARPDVKALAAAMQKLREDIDLRKGLQRRAMNIAAQHTWEKSGAKLLDYCHALEKRPPADRTQKPI